MQELPEDLAYLYKEPYIDRLTNCFKIATDLYRESVKIGDPNRSLTVLFVIEDNERNVIDQKVIEHELYRRYKIHSMRCNFDCINCGKLDPETGVLKVMGKEIAFVYYRTGYQEDHYVDESDSERKWKVREMLECSMAIKCPSVDFQLTTFKKYQ
jgi:hypothetical protein